MIEKERAKFLGRRTKRKREMREREKKKMPDLQATVIVRAQSIESL